jgi:hypothetical protein
MLLVSFVAFISGMVFAGGIGKALIEALIRAGLIPAQLPEMKIQKRVLAISGSLTLVVIFILGAQIFHSMLGADSIKIDGAVNNPYKYPNRSLPFKETQVQSTLNNVPGNYAGVRLLDLIEYAIPNPNAKLVLISANDGYAFFIDMHEVTTNQQLLLSTALVGSNPVFNITGAISSKAWVRGVAKITVILGVCLPINGNLNQPGEFCPQDWQTKMDSINLNLSTGGKKVQGVKLSQVLQSMTPEETDTLVVLKTQIKQFELKYQDIMQQDIRVFTVIDGSSITFTIAKMSGEIIAENVIEIDVQ